MKSPASPCLPALLFGLLLLPQGGAAAQPDFGELFKGKAGCFILFDLGAGKITAEYNELRCKERLFACSTFKIPLSLMAFDLGLLKDETSLIKWDGVDRGTGGWNRDQTARSWLKNSTVWVSQRLTPRIGRKRMQGYLAGFGYGNQDMSGGLTSAWLSSTLKISAEEQLDFLKRLWRARLPVSARAAALTRKSIYSEASASGAVMSGKTGSGFLEGHDKRNGRQVGWFEGHLSSGGREYVFVTNFSDISAPTSGPAGFAAKEITTSILTEMKLY